MGQATYKHSRWCFAIGCEPEPGASMGEQAAGGSRHGGEAVDRGEGPSTSRRYRGEAIPAVVISTERRPPTEERGARRGGRPEGASKGNGSKFGINLQK
ncbi:hypothetical protein E2562_019525 [Oryza meyeriana var. granulata]|uniref:Uncharacterized protein n=1 Tax=Oryza meyeriana var. granulata TaxID=110450 RepID=A0A6G1CGX5_9ORYZ|nr:hypothetical protein E2562_019525 [Oryza meyeriana var. granulata]